MSFSPSKNLRFGLMVLSIMAIALMAVFGTVWATPARAEGTVSGAAAEVESTPASPCGPASKTVSAPDSVTQEVGVGGIGAVQLLSNQAGVVTGKVRVLAIPIVEFTVKTQEALNLGPS